MRFFTLPTVAVLFALVIANTAPAEHVTKSTDSGDNGEMRQVVETAAAGATVTFAPGVHPVVTSGAIKVTADGMSIKGNLPATIITRASASADPVLSMSDGAGKGLTLENLAFQNIARQVGNVETYGGGIVSAANTSNNALGASLGSIANSLFDNNRVTLGNYLHGGGLVGAYSRSGPSSIGDINAVFSNNRIVLTNTTDNVAGRLWGAGLIGTYATEQPATIGNITGLFINNSINAATYLNGAGLVGSFVDSFPIPPFGVCTATIGNIHADFTSNHVVAGTNVSGAGLVGGWSWTGDVIAGDISGTFKDNIVTANSSYMRGGGIVGLRSYLGETVLGKVSASFLNNQIAVGTFLGGGGIVGLYSADTLYDPLMMGDRAHDKTSTVAGIDGAHFINNTVSVGSAGVQNVYALSGVVAVSGLNQELVVNNTIVRDNTLYLTGLSVRDVGGGAFYIGTDRNSANPGGHVLTLTASDGLVTEFRGNRLQIMENNSVTSRFNAITFGREWDRDRGIQLDSKDNAQLNISPQTGGKVLLLDPVKVAMNNGMAFTMNINGPGYFLWGGRNEVSADSVGLNFAAGFTELAPDFQALMRSGSKVNFSQAHTLRMNTTGRALSMPMFQQPDSFTVTGAPKLEGVYYGLDSTVGMEWLVTDQRDGVDAAAFSLPGDGMFVPSLRAVGTNLYLGVNNSQAIAPYTNSSYPNVANAYQSGALAQAWNDAIVRVAADKMGMAFDAARRNPRSLVGESLVSQGLVAMRASRTIAMQSLDASAQDTLEAVLGNSGDVGGGKCKLWGNYLGSSSRQWGSADTIGYNSHFNGLVFGASASWNENFDVGAYFAYAKAQTSYENVSASVDTDITQTGVFANLSPLRDLWLSADLAYTWLNNDSTRDNSLGRNSANFNQHIFSAGLSAKYDFYPGYALLLSPSAGLRYQYFRQDAVAESGLALAQKLNAMSADSLVGNLALSLSRDFLVGERGIITPALYVSWNHEFADDKLQARARYAGYGTCFDISSGKLDRDALELGIGLKARVMSNNNFELNLLSGYNVEFNHRYQNQQFYVGLHLKF